MSKNYELNDIWVKGKNRQKTEKKTAKKTRRGEKVLLQKKQKIQGNMRGFVCALA